MWGIVALVIGILYGWLKPGRQDKSRLLVSGLVVGLVVGLVLAVLGLAVGFAPFGFGVGILGFLISVVIVTLLFVLGVWLGDLIEGKPRRTA